MKKIRSHVTALTSATAPVTKKAPLALGMLLAGLSSLYTTQAAAQTVTNFTVPATATGCFSSNNTGCTAMVRAIDVTAGQKISLLASGATVLAAPDSMFAGPAGITINVGNGFGGNDFTSGEEPLVESGALVLPRAAGTPVAGWGTLIAAFVPTARASAANFVAIDNDAPGSGKVGIDSNTIFIAGAGPAQFTAPSAGTLFLGINDTFAANNTGSLSVRVETIPSTSVSATINNDSDLDGVIDALDVFPCDNKISSVVYSPAENSYGSLMFEDLWPTQGDFDFNDIVLDHNVELYKNAAGNVVRVRATFFVRAHGASNLSGLAWRLPIAANTTLTATKKVGNAAASALSVESGESQAVFRLANNIRSELFANASGLLNADETRAAAASVPVVVDINIPAGAAINTANAPFDVFSFDSNDFSRQIHRSRFAGTDKANAALVGSADDGSSVANQRFYVNKSGIPFVLELPTSAKYPKEGVRIESLYPRLVDFGASAGQTATDFFVTGVVNAQGFGGVLGGGNPPSAPSVVPPSDITSGTCGRFLGDAVDNPGASCKAILDAGESQGDGLYYVDPDGAGSIPPFQARCDMTSDGGGWTLFGYAGTIRNSKSETAGSCNHFPVFDNWGAYDANAPTNQNAFSRLNLFFSLISNTTEIMARRTSVPNNIFIWPVANKLGYTNAVGSKFMPSVSYLRMSRTGAKNLKRVDAPPNTLTTFPSTNPILPEFVGYNWNTAQTENCDFCGRGFDTALNHRSFLYWERFDSICGFTGGGGKDQQWFHGSPMTLVDGVGPQNNTRDVEFWWR